MVYFSRWPRRSAGWRTRAQSALAVCAVAVSCLALRAQAPQNPDPKERVKTARELGKQGSRALAQLESMLSDPVPEVRIEAVKAIVDIGTQASLSPLIRATSDSDYEVQIRATDGLVNFYYPGYVQRGLSASLRRVSNFFKETFTEGSDVIIPVYVQVRPDVIEALGKLARGGVNMTARANAAHAIGILRGQAALPDLYDALRSKDDTVMYESLYAIQKIRDPSAAPHIAYLLRDLDEKVQVTAIETTGLLGNRDALPELRRVVADPRTKKVGRAALTAIAMLPDKESRPLYLKHLEDKDEDMRAAAGEGLARLKDPADLAALDKSFNSERKMPPRLADAFALVMLGRTEVSEFSPLQYLINSLNSTAWRGVARAYLIEAAREAKIRRTLEDATQRATRQEKIELALILSRSGDKDTLVWLDKLSHDPDTEVAQAALNASRTLKTQLP
jgi:HEAT repeat protein